MMSTLTGTQTGPRQLELPPNISREGQAHHPIARFEPMTPVSISHLPVENPVPVRTSQVLRHAADADFHRDRDTSWSRLFKLLLFGRRRWTVDSSRRLFSPLCCPDRCFLPWYFGGDLTTKPRGKHAPARSDGDHCLAWGERMAMDASPDRAGRVG
jgi:hypothetical protein